MLETNDSLIHLILQKIFEIHRSNNTITNYYLKFVLDISCVDPTSSEYVHNNFKARNFISHGLSIYYQLT